MASWAEHSLSLPLWSDPASRPLEDAAASPAPCDAADSAFQGLAMLVADGALALAPHAPQSPARSGAAGAGGCDHAAVGKEGLEPPCAAAEAPAGAPGFRCLTCVGPCYRRCTPPPAMSEAAQYQLLGSKGKKNGEKLLRAGLLASPEWQSAEARGTLARCIAREGDAVLAAALLRKDAAQLRKSHLLRLCQAWGYASHVWMRRPPKTGPPAQATAARARRQAQAQAHGAFAALAGAPVAPPEASLGDVPPALAQALRAAAEAFLTNPVDTGMQAALVLEPCAPLTLHNGQLIRSFIPNMRLLALNAARAAHDMRLRCAALPPAARASPQLWSSHDCARDGVAAIDSFLLLLQHSILAPAAASVAAFDAGNALGLFAGPDRAVASDLVASMSLLASFQTRAAAILAQLRGASRGRYLAAAALVAELCAAVFGKMLANQLFRMQFMHARAIAAASDAAAQPGCPQLAAAAARATSAFDEQPVGPARAVLFAYTRAVAADMDFAMHALEPEVRAAVRANVASMPPSVLPPHMALAQQLQAATVPLLVAS